MAADPKHSLGSNRVAKVVFGVAALLSAALGVMFFLFAPAMGIDEETGRWIAAAFLFVAVSDIALLLFWDRLSQR